jgi:serine/threonine-protein kinase PRP4
MSKRPLEEEDELDMFGDDLIEIQPVQLTEITPVQRTGGNSLTANWDDPEGYYREVLGEVLNERYHVYQTLGKGVFSSVVRAKDNKASKEQGKEVDVAIKIIRNNEVMYKAGIKERDICLKLSQADPDGKRHCIQFLTDFEHKNHLCLVFESLR